MSEYNDLQDFEINLKVAHIILGAGKYDWCEHNSIVKKYITDDKGLCMDYNPCNNPADAMPIIDKYGISLIYQDGKFQFATHDGNIECSDNNPLRASMIVLLCMLDGDYEP